MKHWQNALLMFVAGCVLAWLGVVIAGIASALPWPARIARLSAIHPWAVHYPATALLHWLPQLLLSLAVGRLLFSRIGNHPTCLVAGLVPHFLLLWLLGVSDRLYTAPAPGVSLSVIAISGIPAGLSIAWWLSRRRAAGASTNGQAKAGSNAL